MKRALLAAAASLALVTPAGAAIAQDAVVATDTAGNVYVLTPEQKVVYDTWPVDRRTMYDAWPNDYKVYYWTLTPDQQTGWWVLNDEQRGRVFAMTPEQRASAWASIAAQMSAAATPAGTASMTTTTSTTTNATTGVTRTVTAESVTAPSGATTTTAVAATAAPVTSGDMRFVSNAVVQNIPMDQATGDVPVCKEGQTDNCINAWEAGRRGANVTRPLQEWPGRPASESADPK